jgi:hypothetical protein
MLSLPSKTHGINTGRRGNEGRPERGRGHNAARRRIEGVHSDLVSDSEGAPGTIRSD